MSCGNGRPSRSKHFKHLKNRSRLQNYLFISIHSFLCFWRVIHLPTLLGTFGGKVLFPQFWLQRRSLIMDSVSLVPNSKHFRTQWNISHLHHVTSIIAQTCQACSSACKHGLKIRRGIMKSHLARSSIHYHLSTDYYWCSTQSAVSATSQI